MRDKGFPQKKVLSLVLCVAVMLSVMVMGAGAAFSDQDKIENTEAVNMCTALNIIGGYPDGSYKPEGNIKRSEITKMICVALNGGKEPNVSTNTTPTFSDVRGTNAAWAEGYIESCVAQGIISGVGGGRFSPNGNVTGSQLAKMLLVSLGYNANTEGFVGNAWATNVNVIASQKGLYEGLESMDTSAALTRDNAAQMVWNAMNAYEVEYKTTIITDENGKLETIVTVQDKVVGSNNDKITLLEDKYEAKTFTGSFDGNADVCGLDDGMIQVTGVTGVESKENPARPATFKYNFDVKYIGEEVKVLYKDETGGNANIPDKNDTIYGVVVTGNTTVYNITKGDLQDTATKNKIKFNDKEYKVAAATNEKVEAINYNYGNTTKTVATSSADFDSYKSAFDSLKADSADTIKFIVKDGEIVKAYVVETQFAEIVSINSTKLSLSGGVNKAGLVIEDNSVYEGAKKNDIVAVQKLYSDDYYVISKADIVESTVSASKSNTEVKIDGNYAKLCTTTGTKSIGDYDLHAITDLGESYAFIMYGDYWVAAQQVTESTKDYAVVEKIDANYENAVNPSVKLIKADGTKATAAIDSDSDTNIVAGELVKYKTNNDGSVEMTKAKTANSGKNLVNDTLNILSNATVSYNKNTKQLAFGDNTKKATTSDCVAFIEYETGKYMVAPSDSLGSFTSKTGKAYISLDKDGKVVAFLVSTDGKPSNNASDDVYGYITSRGTEKIGDDTYVMLDVWTADGNITLKTEDLSTAQEKALVAGAFIKFKAGSDVTNAADITDLTETVKKIRVDDYDADRQLLTQKDGTQWPVDKDVTLITINYSEKEGVEDQFDTIPTYDSEANTYNAAIVVDKVDGVDTVVAVYIDVNSDMRK